MSLADLAQFYRRTNRQVELLGGGLWVAETRLSVMSLPGAVPLNPNLSELQGLLSRMRRVAAVYTTDRPTGSQVDVFIVRDRDYGLHSLQRQFRQQVRSALTTCGVQPVAWNALATQALEANRDTALRRGTKNPQHTQPQLWAKWCAAAAEVPGLEASGCYTRDGDLAAYMITWTHQGTCFGLQMAWASRHRRLHPTHALYFDTTRERLARPDVHAMVVGRQTVPHMTAVDRFKDHAGFVRQPCSLAVVLHPRADSLLTHPACRGILRRLRQHLPDSLGRRLAAAEVLEVAERSRFQ